MAVVTICWVSVPQRQRWPSRNIWKMVMRERWFTMAVLGEEGGSGKAFMARNGAFKDLDFALTWHPATVNQVCKDSSLANFQVLYEFKGISAHAAGCPEMGRSALDALEIMNVRNQFFKRTYDR